MASPARLAFYRRVGRPVVTDEERAQARALRRAGWTLQQIAEQMGRVKSTIYWMVKDEHSSLRDTHRAVR